MNHRFLITVAVLSGTAWSVSLAAAEGVTYELRPPSEAWSGCPFCGYSDGVSLPNPLTGTFVLTEEESGPSGTTFGVSDFKVQGLYGGLYTGSGTYRIGTEDPPGQEMVLDVDLGGDAQTTLSGSGISSGASRWPVIEIVVHNQPEEFWSYALYLVASPRTEYVEYQLGPGSQFVVECLDCIPPPGARPIAGTFWIGKVSEDDSATVYRIEGTDLRNFAGEGEWRLGGEGLYSLSRDGLEQRMDFHMRGSDMSSCGMDILMQNEDKTPGSKFPEIDVTTVYRFDQAPERILYTLRLVAGPARAMPFRRGDSNGDGRIDISDAVKVLAWLFLGDSQPGCLESADSNGDSKHDIADAVGLLSFLFLGGEAPPFPGPQWCGLPQEPVFGCDSSAGCR